MKVSYKNLNYLNENFSLKDIEREDKLNRKKIKEKRKVFNKNKNNKDVQ